MTLDEVLGYAGAMGSKAIPNQHDRTVKLTQEASQEGDDTLRIDARIAVQAKVQMDTVAARRHAQTRDGGDFFIRARSLIQHRSLPLRTPGPSHQGGHHKAAFVDKDQPGLQARGFFLMRGHVFFTQPSIASSSRSIARRWGFWGLHPNPWRRRQT